MSSPADIEDWEILDLLTSLADRSLVVAETHGQATRYRLLETVRQYARDRLSEAGESQLLCHRHRDSFLAYADEAKSRLLGPEQAEWLERLEADHDNLRAALETCAQDESAEAALRFCVALFRLWLVRSHLSEGYRHCHSALSHPGANAFPVLYAGTLHSAAFLAYNQGDTTTARRHLEEGLRIYRELGSVTGEALIRNGLGTVAEAQGHYDEARDHLERALAINRELGRSSEEAANLNNLGIMEQSLGNYERSRNLFSRCLEIGRERENQVVEAASLNNLGMTGVFMGEYMQSRDYYEQALKLNREMANRAWIPINLVGLASISIHEGRLAAARDILREAIDVGVAIGSRKEIARVLEVYARLAAAENDPARAVRLWAAAASLREKLNAPLPRNEQQLLDAQVAAAHEALGDDALDTAWVSGATMSMEQAIKLAVP